MCCVTLSTSLDLGLVTLYNGAGALATLPISQGLISAVLVEHSWYEAWCQLYSSSLFLFF